MKIKCTSCGKSKHSEKDYYLSQSFLYKFTKRMPFCKDCVVEVYDEYVKMYNNYKKAIYETCKLIDLPYNEGFYNGSIKDMGKRKTSLIKAYIVKINSLGDSNGCGSSFADSDLISWNDSGISSIKNDSDDIEEDSDFVVTKKISKFWGMGYDNIEYEFLQDEYDDWATRCDTSSKSMEILVKEICFVTLEINKSRKTGGSSGPLLKQLQDLLGSANLKPNQETGANSAEQSTFATLIKKWEDERPIDEVDKELEDVDGIVKQIKIWFTGHLCKMMGKDNPNSKMYEEEIAKYSVDLETMGGD